MDRGGKEPIGSGGAARGMGGVGEAAVIEGTDARLCIGDWYISWGEDIGYGLAGVGGTEDIGDVDPIAKAGSAIKPGMDIERGSTSKERAP